MRNNPEGKELDPAVDVRCAATQKKAVTVVVKSRQYAAGEMRKGQFLQI